MIIRQSLGKPIIIQIHSTIYLHTHNNPGDFCGVNIIPLIYIASVEPDSKDKLCFDLILCKSPDNTKTIMCRAESETEAEKWILKIREAKSLYCKLLPRLARAM